MFHAIEREPLGDDRLLYDSDFAVSAIGWLTVIDLMQHVECSNGAVLESGHTMLSFVLSEDPIVSAATSFETNEGAEVQFLGVVRGFEDGMPIKGIDYSVYRPMAEKMLRELVDRGAAEHGTHRVFIQHRLGFVGVEVPSIIIRVWTKHSAEAFDLCRWYLKEVKTSVPIWKRIVH